MIRKWGILSVFSLASLVGCASTGTGTYGEYGQPVASTADHPVCPPGTAPAPADREPIWGLGGELPPDTVWGYRGPATDNVWHTGGAPALVWWNSPADRQAQLASASHCRPIR